MAGNLPRDDNRVVVLGGITDDSNLTPTAFVVDPTTKRLKVSAIITSGGGITDLNGLTSATQLFGSAIGGGDFEISSSGSTHTFQLPFASGTAHGKLRSQNWTTFNDKLGTAVTSINGITQGAQAFATTEGGNLSISSSGSTHTFTSSGISTAITSLRGLTAGAQTFATANGSLISIVSSGSTHTFSGTAIQSLNGIAFGSQGFATTVAGYIAISTTGTTHTFSSTGTVSVARGGTGNGVATANAVLIGGATDTSALASVSGLGTSGNVLTSNGAGSAPTWQAAAAGGGGYWTDVPGTPTRQTLNTITLTDTGNSGGYNSLISKGTVLMWTQGAATAQAMVISSSYANDSVTATAYGNDIGTAFASMKYASEKARVAKFSVAGILSTGSALGGAYFADIPMRAFALEPSVNVAGTTNANYFDAYDDGVTIMLSRPNVPSGTAVGTASACLGTTVIQARSKVTLDITATTTAGASDAYVSLFWTPENNIYL